MPLPSSMEKLQTLVTEVQTCLGDTVRAVIQAELLDSHLDALVSGQERLRNVFTELGDYCLRQLTEGRPAGETDRFVCYAVTFLFAEQAKAFLLLGRDLHFQQQKGQLLLADGQTTEESLARLREQSKATLEGAASALSDFLGRQCRPRRKWQRGDARLVAQWRLQRNPWPVYREQLAALSEQYRFLAAHYQKLTATAEHFREIRQTIMQAVHICRQEITAVDILARNVVALIEKETEPEGERNLSRLKKRLEEAENSINLPNLIPVFTASVEQLLEALPDKIQVAIHTEAGHIELMELNVRRRARQWLDSEILPLMYEIWEITEAAGNGMKMSLVNLRNRAVILSAEQRDGHFEKADIVQPLLSYRRNVEAAEQKLASLHTLTLSRLETDFALSHVWDTAQPFLPVPIQSTINQFRLNQNRLLNRVQRWVFQLVRAVQQFKRAVEREETLNASEKIVRFLKNKGGDPANSHYTSIFLTKGYIGESFWVGREEELAHVQSLIENWRAGYRGSILLTGQRLSGKTLFGTLVANRFFPEQTIRITPGEVITLQGRRLEATFDLAGALDFIQKYTLNTRPLIWIDDLELWWSPSIPFTQNARALRKFIDDYANRLFVLVSMTNAMKTRLQTFLDIGRIFQAEISLDRMAKGEIREAILIRHGATHKQLVDQEGEEISPPQFRRLTDRIYQAAGGNIGDALNIWASSTHRVDEESVTFRLGPDYDLPDFLTPDSGLVLATLLWYKRTNEYHLRKLFGPAFTEKYGSILQRLISMGLLQRQMDGWLEINELAVNRLGHLLEQKNYLTYNRWKT